MMSSVLSVEKEHVVFSVFIVDQGWDYIPSNPSSWFHRTFKKSYSIPYYYIIPYFQALFSDRSASTNYVIISVVLFLLILKSLHSNSTTYFFNFRSPWYELAKFPCKICNILHILVLFIYLKMQLKHKIATVFPEPWMF